MRAKGEPKKTAPKIESAQNYICPATGLPILRRPEWTDIDFGNDYKLTVSVLGDRIIVNQASGYGTLHDIKNTLRFSSEIVTDSIAKDSPYVHISEHY